MKFPTYTQRLCKMIYHNFNVLKEGIVRFYYNEGDYLVYEYKNVFKFQFFIPFCNSLYLNDGTLTNKQIFHEKLP